MKSLINTSLFFLFVFFRVSAQTVDTVVVYSAKMNTEVNNVIILPENYSVTKKYPVLYLLHGYSGNQNSWLFIKPSLPQEASKWNMIIVCPDGKNSWYWDSPVNPNSQYEMYVSKELVNFIDSNYSTVKSREGRAITGLSMGGHGGMWLGIRHQNIFGACGSISGGVDIRPFPSNWEMQIALGAYKDNPQVWNQHTVINLVKEMIPNNLSIIIDCGTDDFFFEVNERLHRELMNNNIPHDYIILPGKHDAKYWNNAIDYQVMFFSNFFDSWLK